MYSKPILITAIASTLFLGIIASSYGIRPVQPIKAEYQNLVPEAKKQVTCLAENIYFEAGHEPLDGKKAVAFVTMNRLHSGYADDICSVVKQKTGSTCQFSWYCYTTFTNRMLTIKHPPLYNEILNIATTIYLNYERLPDVTNGSTYYHADYVNPKWYKLAKEIQIGRHIFYKSDRDRIEKGIYYE